MKYIVFFFLLIQQEKQAYQMLLKLHSEKKTNPKLKYLNTCFSGSSFKLLIILSYTGISAMLLVITLFQKYNAAQPDIVMSKKKKKKKKDLSLTMQKYSNYTDT